MILLLLLLLQALGLVTSAPAEYLESPENITALIGDDEATFTCRIRGSFMFWRINDILYNYASHNDFLRRGIRVQIDNAPAGEITERLIVSVTRQNNGTKVICQGTVPGEVSVFSEAVFLTIADVPLPPGMNWTALDADTLEVTWTEPFTWTQYPITSYSIIIEATESPFSDNSTVLVNTTLTPSTSYYTITSEEAPSCTLLAITMTASSTVGESEPAATFAALPDSPGEFLEVPNIEVTFTSSRAPRIYINFTFPFLCPYSDSMYALIIRHRNGPLQYTAGPYFQSWADGGEEVNTLIEDPGMVAGAHYTLIINVTNMAGQSNILQDFDTILLSEKTSTDIDTTNLSDTTSSHFTDATSSTSNSRSIAPATTEKGGFLTEIAALSGVVAVALVAVCLVALALVIIYFRRKVIKRKRACIGTVEHPMVRNPIYEAGAIYEEIPGLAPPLPPDRDQSYVTISTSNSKDAFYDECKSVKSVDDSYMPMHSAGTVKDPNTQAASSSDTAATRHALYNNATPTRNGVRPHTSQQTQNTDTRLDEEAEERYIIVVH